MSEDKGACSIPTPMGDLPEEVRADLARILAEQLDRESLSAATRGYIRSILCGMAQGEVVPVRAALACALAPRADAPPDALRALAQDAEIDDVARPVLEQSPVLEEDELLELVRTGKEARNIAIARRRRISRGLAAILMDQGSLGVAAELAGNAGAELDEDALLNLLDAYPVASEVYERMVRRPFLPRSVVDRLIPHISAEARENLVARYMAEDAAAADLSGARGEGAIARLIGWNRGGSRTQKLIGQLEEDGRLTPSLILRVAARGNMPFVEEALARRAGIAAERVWTLLYESGGYGVTAVCAHAEIPEEFVPALRLAFEIYQESGRNNDPADQPRFARRMAERLFTLYEDVEAEDIDGLIEVLSRKASAPEGEAAPVAG